MNFIVLVNVVKMFIMCFPDYLKHNWFTIFHYSAHLATQLFEFLNFNNYQNLMIASYSLFQSVTSQIQPIDTTC